MTEEKKTPPPERRRFLRESLTGSLPLLVDWVTGRARRLARLAEEPRRIAPPPGAKTAPPAPAKEKLDEHYSEFARDNPDSDPYRS